MSPSEDQLRAALRQGQGPGISADRIIAQAREVRHQRRVRYGSALAVAAAVAGIGVGGGFLVSSGGSSSVKSSAQANTNGAANGAAGNGTDAQPSAAGGAPRNAASAAGGLACPATLPPLTAPLRGTGPLFDAAASAMTLCLYPQGGGAVLTSNGRPLRTVLTGSAATDLASSIEGAQAVEQTDPCPLYRTAAGKTLLIIGERADGTAMAPVETQVAQNPCNQPITNGTAVRYNWSPPSSLFAFLAQAGASAPPGQPVASTSPLEQGSPIRS